MTALIEMSPQTQAMSYADARTITERIRMAADKLRADLVEIYTRHGWRVLGYHSWHDYLEKEFDTHHTYLRRQTMAGILEDAAGVPIGTHKESHLRAVRSIAGESAIEAMNRAVAAGATTAVQYARHAMEVMVEASPFQVLRERMDQGDISIKAAFEIASLLGDETDIYIIKVGMLCSDPEMVRMLPVLAKQSHNTWDEIRHSLTIPAIPDPLPLGKATSSSLRAWLDLASAEHRSVAIEVNREAYDERRRRQENVVSAAMAYRRAFLTGGRTEEARAALFSELDHIHGGEWNG